MNAKTVSQRFSETRLSCGELSSGDGRLASVAAGGFGSGMSAASRRPCGLRQRHRRVASASVDIAAGVDLRRRRASVARLAVDRSG